MTDTLSTQMGRKNGRRNKSTASVGSKKSRTASTSTLTIKFHPNVDGFSAFLVVVSKLGKRGQEFTWHDLRKMYHRETQRQLTAEELNAIFSTKNLTKREIFELPTVKRFIESLDGSMMCRFRLIGEPEMIDFKDELPPLMTTSMDSDIITHSSVSPDQSDSPVNEKPIAISTDCDTKLVGPTSDLSKSEASPSQVSLSHQASVQSSATDDEGWGSGKENRSMNSSPVEGKDEVDGVHKKEQVEFDDDVFEAEQRIAAGSDQIDGAVISDVMVVEEAKSERVVRPFVLSPASPILVTESIDAAFEAVFQSVQNASKTLPEPQNASENAKVHATPRKVATTPPPVPAERTTITDELSSGKPIKQLIEKFDNAVNFAEHKPKSDGSPSKSIYKQVLEEIGETEKQIDYVFSSPKKEQKESAEVTNVIFRSTSTHSNIIAQGKEQLAEFVAEQEKKHRDKPETPKNKTTEETEAAFAAKEQSSMSSLDREYFDSKMLKGEDLFAELGVQDADGFELKSGGSKDSSAIMSASNESNQQSSEIITVIEKKPVAPVDSDLHKNRADSIDSDADVPYSLCSEDEAEPMTMIEKSMKVSQSAEQLTSPKDEQKQKTVVVNVELDSKAKRDAVGDATVKERIAALQAAVHKNHQPKEKLDSEDIPVLSRSAELEQTVLEVKPSTTSEGSMRRRQVRFMRGCCTVQ